MELIFFTDHMQRIRFVSLLSLTHLHYFTSTLKTFFLSGVRELPNMFLLLPLFPCR